MREYMVMVCNSCQSDAPPTPDPRWRRMLWIALAINLAMFAGEIVAGIASGSRSLRRTMGHAFLPTLIIEAGRMTAEIELLG